MLTVNSHFCSFERVAKNLSAKLEYQIKRKQHLAVMQLCDALIIASSILQFGATEEKIKNLHNACGAPEVIKCFGYANICQE